MKNKFLVGLLVTVGSLCILVGILFYGNRRDIQIMNNCQHIFKEQVLLLKAEKSNEDNSLVQ